MRESKIWLATGNSHKVEESKEVLSEYGIELEHLMVERIEIQADDLSEIAAFSLKQIIDDGRPVYVEDAGLFLDHYGGFPGPYSSYALDKVGVLGILKLMVGIEERGASYRSAIAFRSGGAIKIFWGDVKGKISHSVKGTGGFGYDPIFIPDEGYGRTFGEMPSKEKNAMSHRARALRKLGEWLTSPEEPF
ncbi:MAG TPA: XTP/dITP diphosphatase [Patescibacteria group bacterium]|nr:XTP/dITP diphosphatase [Patescibacteria group bacterium]